MRVAQRFMVLMVIFFIGFMFNSPSIMAQESAVVKADRQNQAAQDWFVLVDQNQYKGSWDSASTAVRGKITSEQWKNSLDSIRNGLGRKLTRGLESRQEVTSITGLPDGEYVILTFSSSFKNKARTIEVLTLRHDSDDNWRVIAYIIK